MKYPPPHPNLVESWSEGPPSPTSFPRVVRSTGGPSESGIDWSNRRRPTVDPSPIEDEWDGPEIIKYHPEGVPVNTQGQWICGARLRNGQIHQLRVYLPGQKCRMHGGSVPVPVSERSRFTTTGESSTVGLWTYAVVMAISGIIGGVMSAVIVAAVERRRR